MQDRRGFLRGAALAGAAAGFGGASAFGTLQAAWKHQDALFVPKYGSLGFVALPSIWIFQVLLSALSPFAEVAMIVALFAGAIGASLTSGSKPRFRLMPAAGVLYAGAMLVSVCLLRASWPYGPAPAAIRSSRWWPNSPRP